MEEQAGGRTKVVVLVSYLRDWEFWREGGRRLGLDLPRLASESRFVFIDGLTNLFFTSPSTAHSTSFPTVPPPTSGAQKITSPSPKQITKTILSQIDILKQTNDIILILDAPDLLLAATGAGPGSTSVTELGEAILDLREVCSTILRPFLILSQTQHSLRASKAPLFENTDPGTSTHTLQFSLSTPIRRSSSPQAHTPLPSNRITPLFYYLKLILPIFRCRYVYWIPVPRET
ncbi:MAG: hypothetical protein M1819_006348 [Sarea resinae]|nr:MAG: hypothetical protein M1819_006348 [Sarea resinae]